MKIVREAAVSADETTAKIMNWMNRLSMPMNPAKAAASAPIPNQNSTKPDVKISATISIAPRMHQRTQNHSLIYCFIRAGPRKSTASALRQILQHEPDIRRSFGQPAHEVRIPVFSVRNIHSHVESIPRELALKITTHTIQHLKLVLLFSDSFTRSEVD